MRMIKKTMARWAKKIKKILTGKKNSLHLQPQRSYFSGWK